MGIPPALLDLDPNDHCLALFDRTGCLLWRSPAWSTHYGRPVDAEREREVLGFLWHDLIHPSDFTRVMNFFHLPTAKTITFRAMVPRTQMLGLITYAKVKVTDPNLVLVAGCYSLETALWASPPCVLSELDENALT